MSRPIRAAILGASGYGAGELLRLFTQHPAVEVVSVTSSSQVGRQVAAVHPHLRGFYELTISDAIDWGRLLEAEHAVVFSALPHGTSGATLDRLLSGETIPRPLPEREGGFKPLPEREGGSKLKVVDLSGDLRLRDVALHQIHYPESPDLPGRRGEFVYGLPELAREEIREARCVANPGCLAATSILAAAPLVGALPAGRGSDTRGADQPLPYGRGSEQFRGTVVVDATTGSSGSGRQLKDTTHHPTRHADYRAYKPLAHQHEPEILQALGDPHGERIGISFVAHSMDAARGIFVTLHATVEEPQRVEDLRRRYAEFYAASPFVRIVDGSPTVQDVAGSNFCDIGVACRGRQVVVMAALDNLVKGMAGTAIQNMNLMCGLEETTGLWTPAMRPV